MPPILWPSLVQGGLSLIQLLSGVGMNSQRPIYGIPKEMQDKLGQNEINLNARSAAAGRAQENIFQNQATTLQNAQQAGGGVGNQLLAGAMAQANTNRGLANLSASEMEDRQRRLAQLGQAQSEMAGYQDKKFDFNQVQPYENAAATKSALIQGGIQNLFGASQGFGAVKFGQGQQQQPTTSPFWIPQRRGLMFDNRDMMNSGAFQTPNYGNIG